MQKLVHKCESQYYIVIYNTWSSYILTVLMNIFGNHQTNYLPLRNHFTTSFYWNGRSAAIGATVVAHPLLNELLQEKREQENKV